MSSPQTLVFFITGVSSGFGLQLSLLALKNGHHVIGTSRKPSTELTSQFEKAGGKVIALNLAGGEDALRKVMEDSIKIYGRIDVLVNNAGYSLLGAVEDLRLNQLTTPCEVESPSQIETNFFAPLSLIKSILPHMRARKFGTIVNISSAQGFNGIPSTGLYSASKFALEGLSESLSKEVSAFGIQVLLIEPGGFRSDFNTNIIKPENKVSEAYKGSMVDFILSSTDEWHGKQTGDLGKGVQAMHDVILLSGKAKELDRGFLRVQLGSDCVKQVEEKVEVLQKELAACRELSLSTDFVE